MLRHAGAVLDDACSWREVTVEAIDEDAHRDAAPGVREVAGRAVAPAGAGEDVHQDHEVVHNEGLRAFRDASR